MFVVFEISPLVGEAHIDDRVGHCQVNLLLEALPSTTRVDVERSEFCEIGLDISLVFQFSKLSLCVGSFLSIPVFRLEVGSI